MFLIHCPKVCAKLAVNVKLETVQHQIISCNSFKGVKFQFLLSGHRVLNIWKNSWQGTLILLMSVYN